MHTSGHASQEEQKLMLLLTKPKYFFPVHGEYRMLKIHAELSQEVGVPKENSFVLSNGDTILLNNAFKIIIDNMDTKLITNPTK